MKRILNYKTFINESAGASTLTPEQIEFLDDHVKRKWKLNADGVVDVDGDFNCLNKGISDFKGIVFGKVGGYFDCSYNKLTSLEGVPKEVGEVFYLVNNEGVSSETLIVVFRKMIESKLDYSNVLKSLWKEIPIGDKILLYSSDLDWVEEPEASKLAKIKKYNSIKKMI